MNNEIEPQAHIAIFKGKQIRKVIHNDEWYFSIIDIVEVLTDSSNSRRYWSDLKRKLTESEGFKQLYEKIVQLKFEAADGKKYTSDCLETKDLLRLIQSIPSPKAEPFKQWLAKTGYERMQEISDPSQSIDRARENWQKLGRSEKWIQQRMTGQETRNNLRLTNDDLRNTNVVNHAFLIVPRKSYLVNRTS